MNYVIAVITLLVVYMTALIGFTTPSQQGWYLYYLPHFLFFNAFLLAAYADRKSANLAIYSIGSMVIGFFGEVVAVQQDWVSYGSNLGYQVASTPLIMGVFWFIVTYSSACIVNKLPAKRPLKILVTTIISIVLFSLLHQAAPTLGFWSQNSQAVLNFIAPTLISLVLAFAFFRMRVTSKNKIAVYVYGGLFVFAIGLIMFLK